jgi:hypothetical protein
MITSARNAVLYVRGGCGPLVFVDEAAEDGTALDLLLGKVRDRVVGAGRAEMPAVVGAASVVVGLVLGQDEL